MRRPKRHREKEKGLAKAKLRGVGEKRSRDPRHQSKRVPAKQSPKALRSLRRVLKAGVTQKQNYGTTPKRVKSKKGEW